ncbi:MAG: VPLPA-CTERM sorting domain-containing protein [Pseudomonadota bacterium]
MIRTTLASALALGTFAAAPLAASAATFDLFGFPLGTTSQSVTEDGIELDFSSEGGNLHFNGSGVGVTGGVSNLWEEGEALIFEFTPSTWDRVRIEASVFFEVGGGDQIVRVFDASNTEIANFLVENAASNNNTLVTLALDALEGTFFKFTTEEVGNGNPRGNPGLRIQSFEVAEVPLPGAAWLMLTGLAGFFGWRRRNRKKELAAS